MDEADGTAVADGEITASRLRELVEEDRSAGVDALLHPAADADLRAWIWARLGQEDRDRVLSLYNARRVEAEGGSELGLAADESAPAAGASAVTGPADEPMIPPADPTTARVGSVRTPDELIGAALVDAETPTQVEPVVPPVEPASADAVPIVSASVSRVETPAETAAEPVAALPDRAVPEASGESGVVEEAAQAELHPASGPAVEVEPEAPIPAPKASPRPAAPVAPSAPAQPLAPTARPLGGRRPAALDETRVTPIINTGRFPSGWRLSPDEPMRSRRPAPLAVLAFATGERVEVVSPRVVLGRNPAQEGEGTQLLRLPDPGRAVSRNHALLELVDGRWFITDLQSTNGTYAVMGNRDVQLPAGRPVEVRGAVRIGGYEVAFAS